MFVRTVTEKVTPLLTSAFSLFIPILILTSVDFQDLSCSFILFPSFFLSRCLLRSLSLREQNSEKVTGRAFVEVIKDEGEGTGLL